MPSSALDGRSLWWSDYYQQYVQWYWIDDPAWWYERLEIMPSWMVVRVERVQ